jgi:hypothetical protein
MNKIKAIPTTYNGIRYRSRLEATWACFFDSLGWEHEYEPFDLDGYIPDFVLRFPKENVLVEVKPMLEVESERKRHYVRYREVIQSSSLFDRLLLVGRSPWKHEDWEYEKNLCFGYLIAPACRHIDCGQDEDSKNLCLRESILGICEHTKKTMFGVDERSDPKVNCCGMDDVYTYCCQCGLDPYIYTPRSERGRIHALPRECLGKILPSELHLKWFSNAKNKSQWRPS